MNSNPTPNINSPTNNCSISILRTFTQNHEITCARINTSIPTCRWNKHYQTLFNVIGQISAINMDTLQYNMTFLCLPQACASKGTQCAQKKRQCVLCLQFVWFHKNQCMKFLLHELLFMTHPLLTSQHVWAEVVQLFSDARFWSVCGQSPSMTWGCSGSHRDAASASGLSEGWDCGAAWLAEPTVPGLPWCRPWLCVVEWCTGVYDLHILSSGMPHNNSAILVWWPTECTLDWYICWREQNAILVCCPTTTLPFWCVFQINNNQKDNIGIPACQEAFLDLNMS